MDKIESLKIFCRVAELGSYSEAAREQFTSRSGVSRTISKLEKHFAVQLFQRSTRSLSLTDAGRELYNESEKLIRQYEALEDRICRERSEIKGVLRVGVPGPLCERWILPDLAEFHSRYPGIKLAFQVSETLSDLYRDELDMTIRMGPLRDSSLKSVRLAPLSFTLAVSNEYLKNINLNDPGDLKDLNCLCFKGRGRGTNWRFTKGRETINAAVSGDFTAACGYTLKALAVSGRGVILIPRALIYDELKEGRLVSILEDWQPQENKEEWGVHLLYHSGSNLLRNRTFIDFMKEPERLINKSNDIP